MAIVDLNTYKVPNQPRIWKKWNDEARAADRHHFDSYLTELEANRVKLREVLSEFLVLFVFGEFSTSPATRPWPA
jgi:hypothetical protein